MTQDKSRLACRQPLPTATEKQLTFNVEARLQKHNEVAIDATDSSMASKSGQALRNILDHIYNHTTSLHLIRT